MKPINLNKESCDPISSNCVVWQGPDIPCIKLCKGDSVSDVVFKLATELCEILDMLNVDNYDLSCFNVTSCSPDNFQQLIQFLIQTICDLQNITPTDPTKSAGCPDCLVTVADCFKDSFPTGNAQLLDYVREVGSRICTIVLQMGAIQNAVSLLGDRVTVLEGYFPLPTPTEVEITPTCVLPAVDTPVSVVVSALEQQFCALTQVTGDDVALYNAIISQCVADADARKDGGGAMSSLSGWTTSPVATIAQSITNLWLSVCDLRSMVLPTVAVSDTQTIDMSVTAGPGYSVSAALVDTGWVDMQGFGYYTAGMASSRPQCRRIGNTIHFRGTVIIPLSSTLDGLTLIPLTAGSLYNSQATPYTFGGVDGTYGNGVQINPSGAIYFNQNSNCIPSSVWAGATDGLYNIGFQVATRAIDIDITYGTSLSAALGVGITSGGVLYCTTIKDFEITATRASSIGSMPLRYITSKVNAGDAIPDLASASTTIHGSATSGSTTTTTLPAPLAPDTQYINNLNVDYSGSLVYPFSCDATLETQIGGFSFRIDGLTAFIAP